MNESETLQVRTDPRGICTLSLNRSERHNALDADLINALLTALNRAIEDKAVRAIILRGNGKGFCTGLDLQWVHDLLTQAPTGNFADIERFAELLQVLYNCRKPLIAQVQGPSLGGGLGLIACCDLVIAAQSARFGLPELRIGLVPLMIAPYLIAAIGIRQFRRLVITGEPINSDEALRIGLVHHVVPETKLAEFGLQQAQRLLTAAPNALASLKQLTGRLPLDNHDGSAAKDLMDLLQHSVEVREGVSAFLEKRKPTWWT